MWKFNTKEGNSTIKSSLKSFHISSQNWFRYSIGHSHAYICTFFVGHIKIIIKYIVALCCVASLALCLDFIRSVLIFILRYRQAERIFLFYKKFNSLHINWSDNAYTLTLNCLAWRNILRFYFWTVEQKQLNDSTHK